MARPAPIRLAGMIAATATFAALATEAAAQQQGEPVLCQGPGDSACSSYQVQRGDVIATVNLDVAVGQLQVESAAQGNTLAGGVEGTQAYVETVQDMRGSARSNVDIVFQGETGGSIGVVNQARGAYAGITTDQADLTLAASQNTQNETVRAVTVIDDPDARLIQGGYVDTAAIANSVAVGGPSSSVQGSVLQTSESTVFASTGAAVQYIPAEAAFSAQALANAVQSTTTGASHQDLDIEQVNRPSTIQAEVSANAGNAWDLAGRANAGANQANLSNAGGSMLVRTSQTNGGRVRADAVVTAYDYGEATSYARAAANEVVAGNNDAYLELDNTQLNTGGVEASATFSGTNGYDAYVGADAVGNAVTGYACSQCAGTVSVTNNQVNDGPVSAAVNVGVAGSGRSVAAGANAVGNSAVFYVSRPGS